MAALTVCPDCAGKVSTRAECCPHCGAPLLSERGRSQIKMAVAAHALGRVHRALVMMFQLLIVAVLGSSAYFIYVVWRQAHP